jgi:micrococcal nuclease
LTHSSQGHLVSILKVGRRAVVKIRNDWSNGLLAVAYAVMMTRCITIGLVLVSAIVAPALAKADFVARVLIVHEGDRLTIYHQGRRDMVYLRGVDCPELKQPYGKQAKRATAAYIANREVVVRDLNRDRQGRMTVDILLPNGRQIAHELVKEGLAWVQPGRSGDQAMNDMEELARAAGTGLWSEPNPIPPWKWKFTRPAHHK